MLYVPDVVPHASPGVAATLVAKLTAIVVGDAISCTLEIVAAAVDGFRYVEPERVAVPVICAQPSAGSSAKRSAEMVFIRIFAPESRCCSRSRSCAHRLC